jgi:hypothetical protein
MFGTTAKIVRENIDCSDYELNAIYQKYNTRLVSACTLAFKMKHTSIKSISDHTHTFVHALLGLDACMEEMMSRFCRHVVGITTKQPYAATIVTREQELLSHMPLEFLETMRATHTIRNAFSHTITAEKRFTKLILKNQQSDIKNLFRKCDEVFDFMNEKLSRVKKEDIRQVSTASVSMEAVRSMGIKI